MTPNEPRKNEPMQDEALDHSELDRFEQQLRGLHPVAPRALTIPRPSAPGSALVFAAIVLLVMALAVAERWRSAGPEELGRAGPNQLAGLTNRADARSITMGELNAALRTSDQQLNQLLDGASPRLLPRGHRGTALYELGKE
jgi:hypothetical protein